MIDPIQKDDAEAYLALVDACRGIYGPAGAPIALGLWVMTYHRTFRPMPA